MPDWTKSMQQTFEYYIVDPNTWKDIKKIDKVISSTIDWDSDSNTLGSASINVDDVLGECYVRIYMITIQNRLRERIPLGTFLVQTPSVTFDGKTKTSNVTAYTPLIELTEKKPPIGYYIAKDEKAMKKSYQLTSEYLRAPVVEPIDSEPLTYNFVASDDDTWLSFISDLANTVNNSLSLDELGRVIFKPIQDLESMTPTYTYNDDNSSILFSDITIDRDLYGIPNVVEVIYSNSDNYFATRVVNDDPNSPTSTVSRGREIIHRVTDADIVTDQNGTQVMEYANRLLKQLSSVEYEVKYKHGYCGVSVSDCVRLNYTRAGLHNVKAKVISQSIECIPGCPVTETAVISMNLWGG